MKSELPPPELSNHSTLHLRGVRAHKINESDVYEKAELLAEEAHDWGGGSGDVSKDIVKIREKIYEVTGAHNVKEDAYAKAFQEAKEAEGRAGTVRTNPLITEKQINNKLRQLKRKVVRAFNEVVSTNRKLTPFRLSQDHSLPESFKPQPKDRGQR